MQVLLPKQLNKSCYDKVTFNNSTHILIKATTNAWCPFKGHGYLIKSAAQSFSLKYA